MEKIETSNVKGQDVILKSLTNSNSELQKRILTLETERDETAKEKIEAKVDELVSSGRLTPGLKGRVLNLALSSRGQQIKLEKGKEVNLGNEIIAIFEGLDITFEMIQRTKQLSEKATEKKYLKAEEFGDGFKKNVADDKIGFEDGSGKAYWKK